MYSYYKLYKPFNILSQFSDEGNKRGLGSFLNLPQDVYPIGRLDSDSEGLLLLTNNRTLTNQILDPRNRHVRSYLVQVEGEFTDDAIERIQAPMALKHKKTRYVSLPAVAEKIEEPSLPDRNPPIRFRANIPTSWIRLQLREGKNRQVRKMTAAVGFPTLRLVRESMEGIGVEGMESGQLVELEEQEFLRLLNL